MCLGWVGTSYLNKEILEKIEKIMEMAGRRDDRFNVYQHLFDKLNNLKDRLKSSTQIMVYNRGIIMRYMDLYNKLDELMQVMQKTDLTAEEIKTVYDEAINSIEMYLNELKKQAFREELMLSTPIYTSIVIYLINLLSLFPETVPVASLSVALTLSILSALVFRRTRFVSYIILTLSGLIALNSSLTTGNGITIHYSALVYVLIIITSIVYMQTIRTVSSKMYQDRIREVASELSKLAKKLEKKPEEDRLKINELYEKALKIFNKLYGEDGRKLLEYKINIMMMNGTSREEALKKIISLYKNSVENKLNLL